MIDLAPWEGPWPDDDKDANFKNDVALYSKLDPLTTLENLSTSTGIPVGSLCRYILAKWTSAGAEALMALGATAVTRMTDVIAEAESVGTDEARVEAYHDLARQLGWMSYPLEHPEVYDSQHETDVPASVNPTTTGESDGSK